LKGFWKVTSEVRSKQQQQQQRACFALSSVVEWVGACACFDFEPAAAYHVMDD
jgi:hypothetical protein